ncbi:MAG: DUF5798 family protein, partial [Halanaeroarchaeum sp.]
KLQKVVDAADDLYDRMNTLREEVMSMRNAVETTSERVDRLESEVAYNQALLEALAEQEGIDVAALQDETMGGTEGDSKEAGESDSGE